MVQKLNIGQLTWLEIAKRFQEQLCFETVFKTPSVFYNHVNICSRLFHSPGATLINEQPTKVTSLYLGSCSRDFPLDLKEREVGAMRIKSLMYESALP